MCFFVCVCVCVCAVNIGAQENGQQADKTSRAVSRPSIQGGPKKRGHRLVTIILSNLNRSRNSLEDSLANLQLNGYR